MAINGNGAPNQPYIGGVPLAHYYSNIPTKVQQWQRQLELEDTKSYRLHVYTIIAETIIGLLAIVLISVTIFYCANKQWI